MRRTLVATLTALVGAVLLTGPTVVFAQNADKFLDKIIAALPDKAPVQPKQPRKILIYSKTAGFRHSSIPVGVKAITMMGDKTGAYTAVASEDESMFEPERLKAFDAVLMLNTTGECLRPKDGNKEREEMLKQSLVDFVKGGKGLIGTHSATDTYRNWKEYNVMMGGAFVSHPWHKKVPIKVLEPKHPVNAVFEGKDFEITDEIYMFRDDTALANARRYLLALDKERMTAADLKLGTRKDGFFPVAWVATYGKGRNFYCSLGHREEIYFNPMILRHYLAGIQFALGDLEADATPLDPAK
ncbi:MAG: ThuA domain-containing protein [Gemmataceae bacterium]|nr:ThuA domain-containing protein [Gemmataceae bacterium]